MLRVRNGDPKVPRSGWVVGYLETIADRLSELRVVVRAKRIFSVTGILKIQNDHSLFCSLAENRAHWLHS